MGEGANLSVAGIIAEYNPFHLGHRSQICALRENLGESCAVVAVMSGNFVQRGEAALADKFDRAEAAVRCGVDLVLELPTVYAAATAETFARGGVGILHATGLNPRLVFGGEWTDPAQFQAAAEGLDHPAYPHALRKHLARGISFAAARQAALRDCIGASADLLRGPNNALGVEYLRAARRLGWDCRPMILPREGAAHDGGEVDGIASASQIRQMISAGGPWQDYVPVEAAEVLCRAFAQGSGPASLARCEGAVLAVLRRLEGEALKAYDGGREGLYHRLEAAAVRGRNLEEVMNLCKTKRYPMARIRRMILAAYLGLVPAPEHPPYLRVLTMNSRGRDLLRTMRKTAALPILTKGAHAGRLGKEAADFLEREARYTRLYDLARPVPGEWGEEYTRGPRIL